MLGLQGSTPPSKEYQCVTCSATFSGLASLLVHQATHAGSLPMPAHKSPDSNLVEAHPTLNTEENQTLLCKNVTTPMYVCDCGEEFTAFFDMMDHKQSHTSEVQFTQSVDHKLTKEKGSPNNKWDTTTVLRDVVFEEDTNAGPSTDDSSSFKNSAADLNQEEPAAVASAEAQSPVSVQTDDEEQCDIEEMPEETEGNDMDETATKNKPLMKILASAYGKHLVSHPSVDNNMALSLKEESEQVVITPQTTTEKSTDTGMPAMQLKRLLGKPGMKTKAPSISRLLEASTKKIVSLTKMFSPVVVLETRQRFMDPNSDMYGKYQCSRCRRVFQDVDSLTEHHFMHKKERIKCCRCCKQLIIGRIPLPDNHVCPRSGGKAAVSTVSFKRNPTNGQKIIQMNSLNRKKVYFCPICKHNYARRYNLKMHKCRGPLSSQSPETMSLNDAPEAPLSVRDECNNSQSVGVGTLGKSIKIEENEDNPEFENNLSTSWDSPLPITEQQMNASVFAASFLRVQDSSRSHSADSDENGSESRWTMPLNSDVDLLNAANDLNVKEMGESTSVSHSETRRVFRNYFIKDGVRRYPCDHCKQTFCSSCSLSRHEKVCSMNPNSLGNDLSSNNTSSALNVKMYPCYVCGRNFNRKDNMMVHRKKCEQRRTMIPNLASEINSSLPPSKSPTITQDQIEDEDEGNWTIMSLPSVLPRRVTCECGLGFTSPKLLLEHLQKHAQESYTCPTCGVTVKSWAEYENHLQLHMHPQHHKRSQPLLLRFKLPTVLQKPSQPEQLPQSVKLPQPVKLSQPVKLPRLVPDVPEKRPLYQEQHPQQRKKQQRSICSKCGKSFASRCSLRRHISWNRCKALRTTLANKTYHCSLCNTDFPNAISLLFHQRGGTCKPAIKPVRCPICLRWFTTTDGLQKHLLAHKNAETFRCDVCQGTYPSLKSLKIHRRRIHRIMVRQGIPDSMEQGFHGSVSG